ncbi:hypothetical protein J437_LFUL014792 [Ladona fulva]|uniref:Thioredoxin domain-containing protein n=1 Tax=Ladona fulva TaxID=123851 RepID=A0A8K0KG93_LADFU|nr:hypothetical protein J437_LFUL014792 [Ladona fulva]
MTEVISDVTDSTFELLQLLKDPENSLSDRQAAVNNHLRKFSRSKEKIEEFNKDLEWFNVSRSLTVREDFKGKVVVLDFFTYCCINCLHILPHLKQIEKEFSVEDGVIVVGVHSAKFDNEKDSTNLLSALQRYEINHPVVNDSDAAIWTGLGISCWPTVLILGPRAQPLFLVAGESFKDEMVLLTRSALSYFKSLGKALDGEIIEENADLFISDHSIPIAPSVHLLPPSQLLFPGKIACNGDLLAISDTGHHRILITTTKGALKLIIGGTSSGFVDGNAAEARFSSPQGVTFFGQNVIFVADTENHAIRKIDISEGGKVSTVAGIGIQGDDRIGGKKTSDQALNSPWDICFVKTSKVYDSKKENEEESSKGEVLLVAMAGGHQIWAYFLEDTVWWRGKEYTKGQCVAVAGSGAEENRNNAYPHAAAFAQPSGICYSPECIFIADSESSSIRRIWLSDGRVTAVVGGTVDPQMLFAFGDVDGKGRSVRLQHPMGVAFHRGNLYVADTYNHKVKVVHVDVDGGIKDASTKSLQNLPKEECTTVVGSGHPGDTLGGLKSAQFNEPGGLCVSADGLTIFVADTNNHCIKKIDLTKGVVEKVKLSCSETDSAITEDMSDDIDEIVLMNTEGGTLTIIPKLIMAEGLKLTEEAPQKINLIFPKNEKEGKWLSDSCNTLTRGSDGEILPLKTVIPPGQMNSQNTIKLKFNLYLCRENDACFAKTFLTNLLIVYKECAPVEQTVEIKQSL